MIHAQATWDTPSITWTLESTDFVNGYKIMKYADDGSTLEETDYPDKDAAMVAWEALNEEIIQPGYTP